ncbi:hypothetical protein KC19_VG026600 [Ceratodon purpureus]|uniref:Secreted protein n=1 Tax=Ceratodon purpureus TaxID=3225 RepID=A0A8T0HLC2_CERPU|nr:hypothetical protein KC19_VG026600 [Ceratodon purpureus]
MSMFGVCTHLFYVLILVLLPSLGTLPEAFSVSKALSIHQFDPCFVHVVGEYRVDVKRKTSVPDHIPYSAKYLIAHHRSVNCPQ